MQIQISDELLDRIEAALERHLYDHSARRIPADATDSDIVLFELRKERSVSAVQHCDVGTFNGKPHGPVSARLMRNFYGAER